MFGRDLSFNVDIIIRHHEERHDPADGDASEYLHHLLRNPHSTCSAAYAFNSKARSRFKAEYDHTHPKALDIHLGDRVYLRNLAPSPGLSQKLCMPWLGQFRVIALNPASHYRQYIVTVFTPQNRSI